MKRWFWVAWILDATRGALSAAFADSGAGLPGVMEGSVAGGAFCTGTQRQNASDRNPKQFGNSKASFRIVAAESGPHPQWAGGFMSP